MDKHDKRRIFLTVSIIHVPSFTSSDTLNADVSMKSIHEDKKKEKEKRKQAAEKRKREICQKKDVEYEDWRERKTC